MLEAGQQDVSGEKYKTLIVCSNVFVNAQRVIAMGEQEPIVVRKGLVPQIWLLASSGGSPDEFVEIVRANKSRFSIVDVSIDEKSKKVTIRVKGQLVLRIREQGENEANIDLLQLAPLGINIHGSSEGLFVGGTKLVGNKMANVSTAIMLS